MTRIGATAISFGCHWTLIIALEKKKTMPIKSRTLLATLIFPLSCLACASAWAQGSSNSVFATPANASIPQISGENFATAVPSRALRSSSPFEHFDSACEHCIELDHKAVARAIRQGVTFLNSETKHAGINGKEALQRSSTELTRIATSIENGRTYTVEQLRKKFASAHHALAIHHHQVADNARSQNRLDDADEAIRLAAVNLKQGVAWTGGNLVVKPGTQIISSSLKVTDTLIDGTIDGTSRSLNAVGSGIGLLGDKIKRAGRVIKDSTRR